MEKKVPKITSHGNKGHAFRPLKLLPDSFKPYCNIKEGEKAILEFYNPGNENNLKIIAELFWIPPDLERWNKISQPCLSLHLRRFFGIERPVYRDEKIDKDSPWYMVDHHGGHLLKLHKSNDEENMMKWAVSERYTHRYFDIEKSTVDIPVYESEAGPERFIEYCGLSLVVREYSVFNMEKF